MSFMYQNVSFDNSNVSFVKFMNNSLIFKLHLCKESEESNFFIFHCFICVVNELSHSPCVWLNFFSKNKRIFPCNRLPNVLTLINNLKL